MIDRRRWHLAAVARAIRHAVGPFLSIYSVMQSYLPKLSLGEAPHFRRQQRRILLFYSLLVGLTVVVSLLGNVDDKQQPLALEVFERQFA